MNPIRFPGNSYEFSHDLWTIVYARPGPAGADVVAMPAKSINDATRSAPCPLKRQAHPGMPLIHKQLGFVQRQ